jgi:LDH2 family malate/lactate/ureidoglycolate dehydrogenase
MRIVPPALLGGQVGDILRAWGMAEAAVPDTVEIMLEADLRGIDSHGAAMLEAYDKGRHDGSLAIGAVPKLLTETAAMALFSGEGGLGHHVSKRAMAWAVGAARANGLALAAVRHSHHFGAAGPYAEMAARAGLIGLAMTPGLKPAIVPTRARTAMFGTNPIAFAAPVEGADPILLDMATSTVALGKLKIAALNHKPIPPGWAFRPDGSDETDPVAGLANRLLSPLGGAEETGGYKGYGLAMMVEVMTTMLAGAGYTATQAARRPGDPRPDMGHMFLCIDPAVFRAAGDFAADTRRMVEALRAAPRKDPERPLLIPGEREFAIRHKRVAEGIPMPDDLLAQIAAICRDCGAPFRLG